MEQQFALGLVLFHERGDRLYPVRMKNRDSGRAMFRMNKAGNTKDEHVEFDSEADVVSAALAGHSIRCSTLDRSRKGLYSITSGCIRKFEVRPDA